jgi:hypothetical protein
MPNAPILNNFLHQPPKFIGPNAPAPETQNDWTILFRWFQLLWSVVSQLQGQQGNTIFNEAFGAAGQPESGFTASFPAATGVSREIMPGVFTPLSPTSPQQIPQQIPQFPKYYVLPTIGPTIIDVVANLGDYPPSSFVHWLFLDSATLLFQYSDGTNWNPVPINTAAAGNYPLADVTVDANGRVSMVSAGTGTQIDYALGYTPATKGADATVTFSLTANLITGAVTGTITAAQV